MGRRSGRDAKNSRHRVVIVPDSSAWIEHLRDTGSPTALTVRRLLEEKADIGVTEHVLMELLAGAQSLQHLRQLRSELLGFQLLPLIGLDDYEDAAAIYRACRLNGITLRNLSDCLVAVPVIREGAELLHNDSDFDAIAQHSALRIYPVGGG